MKNGFIYVATGERYVREAENAAQSLRRHMPDADITLLTDKAIDPDGTLFNSVIVIPEPQFSYEDKITGIQHTPYERTVLLDVDTWVCDDISELFDALDRFDIAAALRPREVRHRNPQLSVFDVAPVSFPGYNTGILVFKKSPAIESLFKHWQQLQKDYVAMLHNLEDTSARVSTEQAFREALYQSTASIMTLSAEYNCFFGSIGGSLDKKVKILHGRHPNYEHLERLFNIRSGRRMFIASRNRHFPIIFDNKRASLFQLLSTILLGHNLKTAIYLLKERLHISRN